MKLSIIVPMYNEADSVRSIIRRLDAVEYPCEHEIILVDDASSDRTRDAAIVMRLREGKRHIRFYRNRVNLGKGSSIRRGLKHASGDIVIIQDADTEYDPADIPKLIRPIIDGSAQVVYGSRFMDKEHPRRMAFGNLLANKLLNALANFLYSAHLTDVSCCYKAMPTELLKSLALRCRRFEFCHEVTAKLRNKGIDILELPVSYVARSKEEGKKIRWIDLFNTAWTLIKYKFI